MRGHHASLLAALREEDTDDEFDDDAFAFVPKGQETPSTPRGAHRVFTAGKESTDSPTSPLVTHTKKEPHTMTYGFAPPAGDAGGAPRAATPPPPPPDIRVFLSNGASAPVEVLRNQIVTSLTLKLDRDAAESLTTAATTTNAESVSIGFDVGFDPPAAATTRTLLLPESSNLPKIDELSAAGAVEDPAEYRELMLKLGDLRYICIRAATEIGDDGEAREREYWLPLDESQTVADIKTLAAGADLLEPDGPRLLDVAAGETPLNLSATHAGRTLDDASTVSEEGLTHNTVIRLCVRERANVVVKMRGTKDLEVSLTADETAASLRAKLEQMRLGYARDLGGPYPRDNRARDSQLFFGGQELRDGPLNVYGVADGATLELRPHTSGVSGLPIPATFRGSRERHSWNGAAAWSQKPAAAAAGSWVSSASGTSESGRVARFGGAYDDSESSRWSGFGSASSSSSEHHGSPEVARSFDLARRGLAMGNRPQLARGGTGGAYFLRDGDGETCAVFKPADEEPNARNNPRGRNVSVAGEGLRKGTRVGEGASREVAAYLLDHDGFAAVPATSLANLCDGKSCRGGGEGEGKLGSLQAFVRADAEAEELGPGTFPDARGAQDHAAGHPFGEHRPQRGEHPRAEARRSARGGHRRGSRAHRPRVRAPAHARGCVLRVGVLAAGEDSVRRRDQGVHRRFGRRAGRRAAPLRGHRAVARLRARPARVHRAAAEGGAEGVLPGGHCGDDVAPDAQPRQRLGEARVARGGGGAGRRRAQSRRGGALAHRGRVARAGRER
jgi:hypothetical protein